MVGITSGRSFMAEREAIKAAEGGQRVDDSESDDSDRSNDAKPTPTGRIFVDFLNGKFSGVRGYGAEPGGRFRSGAGRMWLR